METYHCMFLVFCLALHASQGKIYTIDLKNQAKDVIPLSTFGYLPGGSLEVNITSLKLAEHESPTSAFKKVGLRIDKSSSGGRSDFMEGKCPVTEYTSLFNDEPELARAVLTFIFENETKPTLYLQVCSHNFSDLHFFSNEFNYDSDSASEPIHHNAACVATTTRKQRDVENSLPVALNKDGWFLSTSLYFKIDNENQAGLYEIYLHNCDPNSHIQTGEIHIIEQNDGTYLSAGEIALPTMYGIMAMFIFITAFFWVGVLWKNRSKVFTIHYLMALLMFIKALSITFHAIDYHFIGRDGMQEAWAVIFYIVHLLKGILLFICLLLIGTGWAFIKYVLSDREKKLFMIVIPLQIVANIAYMIQEEEQGNMYYNTFMWTEIIVFVDILCFGIILISVVWSVRHLQDASKTDGKAAINLTKLKLFQQFYVMVICYLYFRRVIVYMLKVTLPFRYTWIHLFVYELVSVVFFIVTGYKFRPGCDNPYLSVPQDDDDIESHALTESGVTETIAKVNQYPKESLSGKENESLLSKQRTKNSIL